MRRLPESRLAASTVADVSVTAIIPLKALADAKGRLSGVLDAPERRALVAWMAGRVISACQACELIGEVLVVAGDDEGAALAVTAGASAFVVQEPGLLAALEAADLRAAGADATIIVAADLPAATAQELAEVILAAPAQGPTVVIAPTDDGGTGALLRRPSSVIPTAYGPDSAARHIQLAAAAGIAAVVVRRPGLSADVDTPEQLPPALALIDGQDVGFAPR